MSGIVDLSGKLNAFTSISLIRAYKLSVWGIVIQVDVLPTEIVDITAIRFPLMAMYKKPHSHEGAVSPAFSTYLRKMCEKQKQSLNYVEKASCVSKIAGARSIVPDATVFDQWGQAIGHIEFKDDADDLDKEISKKTK